MTIKIAGRSIGLNHPPFIIAEMSGNHNQSLDRALKIVEEAANCGVHALKLQTYTADTLTLDVKSGDFLIDDQTSLWKGRNLYDLYNQAHTPWEWHKPIIDRAKELGLICFSSPFDETAVEFLEDLNVPAYKIASFENNHLPLIKKTAETGKPLIISLGMAKLSEAEKAVETARNAGCDQIVLLKCTSTYPADPTNTNLKTIPQIRKIFNCEVGLSDHTLGIGVALASISLGSTIIEKHFTLDRNDGGVDSSFSLEPKEFKSLVCESHRAWQSLGEISFGPTKKEMDSKKFRRSIYVSENINTGEKFTNKNLRILRPGYGAPPYLLEFLIGKTSRKDYLKGEPLSFDSLF